jgi:hypothetical protein
MTKIVGINGLKQSGKGTSASLLRELADDRIVYEIGFADKLKILASRLLGYEDRDPREAIARMDEAKLSWDIGVRKLSPAESARFPDVWEPVTQLSGRSFLQNLGNEARQLFGDNFWIDQVLPRPLYHPDPETRTIHAGQALAERYPDVDVVVITDLRYENEAVRVKQLGGVVWEVVRPGVESDGHITEQPLPDVLIDHVLHNRGSLTNLRWEVEKAMELTL